MNEELIKAIKSLLSDVESMQNSDNPNWIGGFYEYATNEEDGDIIVEWPNLAISAARVKELLEGAVIDGSLAAPQLENPFHTESPEGKEWELIQKGLLPEVKVGDYVTGYAEAFGTMSGEIVKIDLGDPSQFYQIKSASGWDVWLQTHTVELAAKIYPHTEDKCPSNHWNDGTDICEDCGKDLHT